MSILERWQHASQDLESKIFLVSQPVGAPLDDANLVVQPFDKAQRDLVLRLAIGGDSIPMALDHLGDLLVGRKALSQELQRISKTS